MSVQFKKATAATTQVPSTAAIKAVAKLQEKVKPKSETTVKTEELVALHTQLTELKAFDLIARYEELKKELQSIANENFPADEEVTFACDIGSVTYSKLTTTLKPLENEVVLSVLPAETALKVCKFGVTELRKYLTPKELAQCTVQVPGSRKLSAVLPKGE